MRRAATGLTLTEMVMAMAMTVIIGLAVAGVTRALSQVQAEGDRYHERLQNGRMACQRLQAMLREAKLVASAQNGLLVLWASDNRDPGQINLSEVAVIYRNSRTNQLIEAGVVFPPDMSGEQQAAMDSIVPLKWLMDIRVVGGNICGMPVPAVPWVLAHNVRDFRVYPDGQAPMIRMVKFMLIVETDGEISELCGGATLRADKLAEVGVSDGTFFLYPPGAPG